MPETTYTLIDTSSEFMFLEPSTFTTGTDTSSVVTQTPEVELRAHNYNEEDDFCGISAHYSYTVSVSNVVIAEDQNTHLYLNQVDADGNLLDIERMIAVDEDTVTMHARTSKNGACFTVSHHDQNGAPLARATYFVEELTLETPRTQALMTKVTALIKVALRLTMRHLPGWDY